MNKILYFSLTIAALALFSACEKDKFKLDVENESVKKLPESIYRNGNLECGFQYDNLNRLTTITYDRNSSYYSVRISYNERNAPISVRRSYDPYSSYNDTIVYKDNQVFIMSQYYYGSYDTAIITLNSAEEMGQARYSNYLSDYTYTYNSNGNLSTITYRSSSMGSSSAINIQYSTAPSIFRHVNTPDWFFIYYSNLIFRNYNSFYWNKKGYMFGSTYRLEYGEMINSSYYHTYETDSDGYGYVREINPIDYSGEKISPWTVQYIFAK